MAENNLPTALNNFVESKDGVIHVNASCLQYKDLNTILRNMEGSEKTVQIDGVCGQRYIGTDLKKKLELQIHGTPGNDLAAFMDGSKIIVYGNVQDGVGNTMNSGTVIVHGKAGDIIGNSMRGGEIYIRDCVGYRCGIHMKEYGDQKPTIVVGGTAQDYLGEYMAGGYIIVLGLGMGPNPTHRARFVGTGMHGGTIYIRGKASNIGKEAESKALDEKDFNKIEEAVTTFKKYFDIPKEKLDINEFTKLVAASKRPYAKIYTS